MLGVQLGGTTGQFGVNGGEVDVHAARRRDIQQTRAQERLGDGVVMGKHGEHDPAVPCPFDAPGDPESFGGESPGGAG